MRFKIGYDRHNTILNIEQLTIMSTENNNNAELNVAANSQELYERDVEELNKVVESESRASDAARSAITVKRRAGELKRFKEFLLETKKVDEDVDEIFVKRESEILDILDFYANWIFKYQIRDGAKKGNFYKPGSALKIFSTAKTAIEDAYVVKDQLKWGKKCHKISKGMYTLFFNRCVRLCLSVEDSHVTADEEDLESLTSVCYWANSYESAQFASIMTGMTQFVGRGMEVALCKKDKLKSVVMEERGIKWRVLHMSLDRTKNQRHDQPMHLFKHRTSMMFCFYHQSGYHLVLQDKPSPFWYPNFGEKTGIDVNEVVVEVENELEDLIDVNGEGGKREKSQVSGIFNAMIKKMEKECSSYPDDFELAKVEKITSHSLKRRGVNILASSPLISPSWTFLRAGTVILMKQHLIIQSWVCANTIL